MNADKENIPRWFAIKTRAEFRAEELLAPLCDEVFLPRETVKTPSGKPRIKAAIPHILFIKTTPAHALELEQRNQFWIYRYPKSPDIQPISQANIDLLRLLTADDATRCHIYAPSAPFTPGQRVRVTAGPFAGCEGTVRRIGRNRHVIVAIQGLCLILLPFIHPTLLQPLP